MINFLLLLFFPLIEGDLRLADSSITGSGRVEVYRSGQWGTVCDDGWDNNDATVVCRQLGYSTSGAIAQCCGAYGQGSGPILMDNVACSGTESTLTSCSNNTNHNCGHYEDAGIQCQIYSCQDGDLRLVGGQSAYEGRVEVCLSQRWGTVTDDGWSTADAQVVCKLLGYSSQGAWLYSSAHFGEGTGPIFLTDLECSGSESNLFNCSHTSPSTAYSHSEDAGIRCSLSLCQDGDVRLVGGQLAYEGRVEVCFSQRWGTVADDGWPTGFAQVVCRQLGYDTQGAIYYSSAYFGQGRGPILMDRVWCSGSESRLLSCSYTTTTDDTHSDDAGVKCLPYSCQDGDVRLVGGQSAYEGRVEVCLSQRWGTVTDDGWSTVDAQVVCRQLGYNIQAATYHPSAYFGQGTGPVLINNVECSGSESRLLTCSFGVAETYDTHSKDVSIRCLSDSCQDGDVRLVGGQSANEGRVEVCLSQRWGTVTGDGWSTAEAQVVCRQLGYNSLGAAYFSSAHFGQGIGPIVMDSVRCSGNESCLLSCFYDTITTDNTHSDDSGVQCLPFSCQDGDVKLVGGQSAYEGRVEVCLSQRWGTICDYGWSEPDGLVVCKQLGYSSAATFRSYSAKCEAPPRQMNNVKCFGSESSLVYCRYSSDVPSDCDVIEVQCISESKNEESNSELEEEMKDKDIEEESGDRQDEEEEKGQHESEDGSEQEERNQRVELKKEQDNQFKTPFIILLVLFVVGVLLTIVIVVLKYLKKRRSTAENFSVRFQDLIKERDEAKNMQDQNAFEKSKEYAAEENFCDDNPE